MRCGQAAKMPDAVSVVRAATTPSAIAPFETTESGRELGQAEPLMAPWWKLGAGGPYKVSSGEVQLLCIVQTTTMQRGQCAARGLLCYRATTPAGNAAARRAAGGGRCGGVEHVSRLILQHCAESDRHRICPGQQCSAGAAARQSLSLLQTPTSLLGCCPAPALDVQLYASMYCVVYRLVTIGTCTLYGLLPR
jgi:hypothetical protein